MPGVIGKFGLGVQNEAGQRLTEFSQDNTLLISQEVPWSWTELTAYGMNRTERITGTRAE